MCVVQIQHTKNLNPERFDLGTTLSQPNRSNVAAAGVKAQICLLLGKINAHYFSREDFTTNNSKCISIRKGEVAQLLEVQPSGWWKMNVEGVVGWTPGDFWDILQVGFVHE